MRRPLTGPSKRGIVAVEMRSHDIQHCPRRGCSRSARIIARRALCSWTLIAEMALSATLLKPVAALGSSGPAMVVRHARETLRHLDDALQVVSRGARGRRVVGRGRGRDRPTAPKVAEEQAVAAIVEERVAFADVQVGESALVNVREGGEELEDPALAQVAVDGLRWPPDRTQNIADGLRRALVRGPRRISAPW